MINYTTLEGVSYESLYGFFEKAFVGFRSASETTCDSFSEMLKEKAYDPTISIGAFDSETGELVSFVLNCIVKDDEKTAYDILTGTLPEYRRQGISRTVFDKVKELLKQRQVVFYTTEVKRDNTTALKLYLSIGFHIKEAVETVFTTSKGSRTVSQYEIVVKL